MAHVHLLEHGFDALLALGGRHLVVAQWQLDVLEHRELVDEIEALEYEAEVRLAQLRALAPRATRHFLSEQLVAAVAGRIDEPQDMHERRLAAARRPHQRHELPRVHFDAHAIERGGFHFLRAIDPGETVRCDDHCLCPLAAGPQAAPMSVSARKIPGRVCRCSPASINV